MTVTAGAHFNSGDDRGNDGDIVIPNVTTPASGTFAIAVMIHQHQGIETVTGITFGATGATFAEAITGLGPSSRRNSIWRSLNAPANTTADITITMSGNNRPKGADALILSSDTGNIAVIGKSAFSGSNTAITGSVNPLGAGHELIGCCTYGTGGGSVAPTAPTVELWDLDASGPGPDSDYWTARRSTTGTGSHTIAGTITGTQGWHMVIAEVTDDPPPPNFATVANGHKIYNNGSVSDAVVLAGGSSGTPASVVEGGTYQVRVGVQNTSGAARNFNPQLQYRLNGGSWVNCNAASVVARVVASENVLEGTATTQRSTTGTFTAGSFEDTDGLIAAYSVPNNNFTEVVYTVWIDPAQVVASDTLEFRVDDQASAPPSGTLHLYCTIVAAALPGIVAHDESVVSVENACSRWMWVDTNDNLYVITEGGWNQNHDAGKPPAVIRKSSDGGLTWRVIDFKDFLATGNGDLEGTHVVDLGSGEWMIVHIETGDDVYGDIFRTSDHATTPDNWVTPLSTLIQDGADSLSALMTHVTAAARQNGQVLAVYSNEPTGGGNDRLYWNLRNTTPAWDASPGTELESTASTDYTGPVMSPGLSSRSLLCFCDTTNNVLYFRWASSADPPVWDARVQVNTNGTTVANSLNGPVMAFVRYDDTNDYHAVVWLDNSNNLQLNTIKWNGSDYDVGTTPTQINTVSVESNWPGATETEDLDNQGANGTGVADPATGTVHMLYADATNRDLYYNTWTEAGGAGTEALEFNPSGSEGIGFVDAVVYNSKVGYVYELVVGNATPPGRGMFYDEITLSATQNITPAATTVTVTPGSLSLAIEVTLTAPTLTVTPGTTQVDLAIAATGPTITATPGTLTITTGAVDITPAATTVTVAAGSLSLSVDVTPAPLTVTASDGTLTVTPGAVDITPAATTVTAALGTLTVTPGAVDITPAATTVTATSGTLTVTLTQPITPAATTVTATTGTLTITTGAVDITPDPTTVTVVPGTSALSVDITPAATTVTVTAGTVTTDLTIAPTGPTVTVTPGTLTVSLAAAPPSIAGTITTTTGVATSASGIDVTLPSGISSGETVGIVAAFDGSSTSLVPPGTVTQLAMNNFAGAGLFVGWLDSASVLPTPPATINFGLTGAASEATAFILFRVTATADPTVSPPVIGTAINYNTATPDPPTITPAGGSDDYLAVPYLMVIRAADEITVTGFPSGYSNNTQAQHGSSADGVTAAIATKPFTGASENPGVFTLSASQQGRVNTMAFYPTSALAITPAAVTVTATAGTLTVTTGAVDITPAATTVDVTAGTTDLSIDITPAATTVTTTVGSLTVTPGTVDITPAATTVTVTPGSLTVSQGGAPQNITPAASTVTVTANTLTVTPGAVDITPDPTTVTVVAGTVTVDLSVVPAPTTIAVTAEILTVTTGAVDITPAATIVNVAAGSLSLNIDITTTGPTVTVTAGNVTVTPGAAPVTPDATTITVTPGTLTITGGSFPDWVHFGGRPIRTTGTNGDARHNGVLAGKASSTIGLEGKRQNG